MKSQSYMNRALRSRDPRYAFILGRLGYRRRDLVAGDPIQPDADDMVALRGEYQDVVGKRPFNGWDADTLRARIDEAKD